MSRDPTEASRIASMGGTAKAAKYPAQELTAAATIAANQRFVDEARRMHPDADEREIVRVAGLLLKLHMKRLSHKRWAKHRAAQPFTLEPGR